MKHLVQQREILNEMGIDWWIKPSSQTFENTCFNNPHLPSLISSESLQMSNTLVANISHPDSYSSSKNHQNPTKKTVLDSDTSAKSANIPNQMGITSSQPKVIASLPIDKEYVDYQAGVQKDITINNSEINDTKLSKIKEPLVRPFRIQALHFNSWVLLVDESYLQKNEHFQTLWTNICIGLDKPVEQLKFPLVNDVQMVAMSVEPMNTVTLANATLAGFVFGIVQSNDVQLAGLTELPEGLNDSRIVTLPLLEEMIKTPSLKKKFWEDLNHTKI